MGIDAGPFLSLPATETTLSVGYYNHVWENGTLPVTFQVNMGTQQAAGAFNPDAGDVVEVRGAFNDWSGGLTLTASDETPGLYLATAEVPQAPGARIEYKFVIIPAATGQAVWENDPNRNFLHPAESQTLPAVYFNNVTGVPVKGTVAFAVDMSVLTEAGQFDPTTQEVYVRGNKFGWGTPDEGQGIKLIADASRAGVYTNVYTSDSLLTGDRIEYKRRSGRRRRARPSGKTARTRR